MKKQIRPDLLKLKEGKELMQWYWLKEELINYCKKKKIPYTGSKAEIKDRIAQYLDNGKVIPTKKTKTHSKFDWHSEALSLESIITDSYKNSNNVRRFMEKEIGSHFKFNIPFMKWMKDNVGKTLKEARDTWITLEVQKKDKNFKSYIPSSNQYNQYVRDFFADNPDATITQARKFWKLKRSLPGHNKYEKTDLYLQ